MKGLGIFLTIVVLLGIIVYFQGKTIWDKIKFSFSFKGVDFGSIDFTNTSGNITANIKLTIAAKITNENKFDIPFKNLRAWIYYENTLIAKTSEELSSRNFKLLANSSKIQELSHEGMPVVTMDEITDQVSAYLNQSTLNLARNFNSHPQINYTVKMTIFWVTFSYDGYFNV